MEFVSVLRSVSSVSLAVTLCCVFLGLLWRYLVYPYSVLSRCGIKHPKVVPLFGNFFMLRKGVRNTFPMMVETCGKVCGYYLGERAVVLVANTYIIYIINRKDFRYFPKILYAAAFRFDTTTMSDLLPPLGAEQRRTMRTILSKSFRTANLKEMIPFISTKIKNLRNCVNTAIESGVGLNFHRHSGCFMMEVLAGTAFSLPVDTQNSPDHALVHLAEMFFSLSSARSTSWASVVMPPLAKFLPNNKRDQTYQFFINFFRGIIQQRKEQPLDERPTDFLQLMLDAQACDYCLSLEHSDTSSPHVQECPARCRQRGMMTEDEIVAQATLFLLAGYETATNALSFTVYLLALHPDCQFMVQEEVDEFFMKYSSLNHKNVKELKYLDMVLSEVLRLYPPAFSYSMDIDEDFVVDGQVFPKGATLEVPVFLIHQDPDHWPEPDQFIPERFTPEAKASRHPCAYLPFGVGPRDCVEMRLINLTIRMALVQLFRRFNVVACPETEVPLELDSTHTIRPKNGIFVKFEKRDDIGDQPNSSADE